MNLQRRNIWNALPEAGRAELLKAAGCQVQHVYASWQLVPGFVKDKLAFGGVDAAWEQAHEEIARPAQAWVLSSIEVLEEQISEAEKSENETLLETLRPLLAALYRIAPPDSATFRLEVRL